MTRKYDGKHYNVYTILTEQGIETNRDEVFALGKQLVEKGLVTRLENKSSMDIYINGKGVSFVDKDSYSDPGISLANNSGISISGSTNTNIIQNSSNVSISQSADAVNKIIEKILEQLQNETVEAERLQDIKDCLVEIRESVAHNIKPKFAFRESIKMTSNFSSIGSFVLFLGQTIGLH
jgi:hypothetical protein